MLKTNMRGIRAFTHLLSALLLGGILVQAASAAPAAFEIGPYNHKLLPGGKEADGIVGDFVLRNSRVEAVISGNLPLRRANMSTFYNAITPGCLYDLTLRGENNDQLTIFTPSGQQGPVSFVRIVKDGRDGEAVVETVTTAANNNHLFRRQEHRLREDWQGLLIVTTLRNEGTAVIKTNVTDRWTTFSRTGTALGISWADAVDPADKAGYAHGWVERDGLKAPPNEVELKSGEELSFARFIAVGQSPAQAVGLVAAFRGPVGTVSGTVLDAQNVPAPTARIAVHQAAGQGAKSALANLPAYPDAQGRFSVQLPPGNYELEISDLGRPAAKVSATVKANETSTVDARVEKASVIALDIQDEQGRGIPCKAQFIGVGETKSPNLGPANRARGCLDQYHSHVGRFQVQIPPGTYKVIVTRGIEYSHLVQTVEVRAGQTQTVKGALRRLVDTTGWVSSDFHNHSTPSGDNTCGTDDRIINLAAEHIEFAPTTEHNRLYDWTPHIKKLALQDHVSTIPGIELTGGGPHFNAFPYQPKPQLQDGGAPVWARDPRLNAVVLRDYQGFNADRWLQINHPDMVENFIDRDGDGRADGGYLGLGLLIDSVETQNGMRADILAGAPYRVVQDRGGKESVSYLREFIWLQLLNRGARYWGVAVSDAHSVHGNGVGGWRMYVPSSSDAPAEIDWVEISRNSKAGRIVLSSGPYLEVQTADGILPGGETRATSSIDLKVKVQCTDWIDIDRVQVLVNGRQRPDLNFTRKSHPSWFKDGVVKFDRTLTVPLSEDSHLIVVAYGEDSDLSIGYGTSEQARLKPCAYNNPIFVDVDGGGFRPNGDTLGHPLPVKKLSVEQVRKSLGEPVTKPGGAN